MAISRRKLIGAAAGFTTLLMFETGCGGGGASPGPAPSPGPTPGPGGCDGVSSTSTVDSGHDHQLCVPNADLNQPPSEGRSYTSSTDAGHAHTVRLSADQLRSIASGGSVNVTSSGASSHTHEFTIRRA